MMNKKWTPHGITVVGLLVLGFLGLACASAPAAQKAFNNGDVLWLTAWKEYDKVLELLRTNQYKNLDSMQSGTYDNKGARGFTALVFAAQEGKLDVVKALVEKGADIDAKSETGWTPLMNASNQGKIDVVKLLVEKGAKVNLRVTDGADKGKTAAVLAYDRGHLDIYNYLKEHGTVDFEPIQSSAPAASQGQAAPQGQAAGSGPASQSFFVTVWYEINGTRMGLPYTVTASSKGEAEREAERLWKSVNGWNTNAKFLEAVANF